MKTCIIAAFAVCLTACSPLAAITGSPGQASNAEVLRGLGEHISACDRHYQGGLGVGASFTFNIDCKGQPARP